MPPIRRDRFKLSCGGALNVYGASSCSSWARLTYLPSPHFPPGLGNESTFLTREDVVGIHQTFGFDQYAVVFLSKRHEVSFPHFELFENLPWDDHLAALAYAADGLSCSGLTCHIFRLAEYYRPPRIGAIDADARKTAFNDWEDGRWR